MKFIALAYLLLTCLPNPVVADAQADEYRIEVYKRALSAQSRMTVLSLALQPGFEDLGALAYLRFGRGARIVNAFVTNGESGDNDMGAESPGEVAFHRREEAFQVSSSLRGTEYFLNFPDFGSARDTSFVGDSWPTDSLEIKLVELIESVRPDLVLLAPDRQESGSESPRWNVVRSALRNAAHKAAQKNTQSGFIRPRSWQVGRLITASPKGTLSFPLGQKPEFDSRSFRTIGAGLAQIYESMKGILPAWQSAALLYSVDYPSGQKSIKLPDSGIPGKLPASIQSLGKQMDGLWNYVLTNVRKGSLARTKSTTLKRLVGVMDSIDVRLSGWNFFANTDRKTLLHWKEGLEELRNAIFGVSVRYTMRDTVLLARQLTTMRIDSVIGLPADGTTEIFFPDVGPRWFLNEGAEAKVPLVIGSEYRLISPSLVNLDLPISYGGRMKNLHGSPFEFFILHQRKSRAESFFKKTNQRILFAPKLTVEPLTPIVRIVPHEQLVYRITNHSNDGIQDKLGVQDTLATADPEVFRLNKKGLSVNDTLHLKWNESVPEGTYRIPLQISGTVVGYFGARKFDVLVDSNRTIGILATEKNSVMVQSLRRLGVRYRVLDAVGRPAGDITGISTLVLDERLLSLRPASVDSHFSFGEFMEQGGTLLVLSQDADVWNSAKIVDGITLLGTSSLDAQTSVVVDTVHRIGREPNLLAEVDWEEWLFSRSQNKAYAAPGKDIAVPVRLGDGNQTPGILVLPKGKGKLVYVNLNLGKQLENIHPGVFRLLANLLAF